MDRYFQAGLQARELGDYGKALKKLQRGRELLRQRGVDSPEICLLLGAVFVHFGQWLKAETVLEEGLKQVDPASELALQLHNGLAEVYHMTRQFQRALALCEDILRTAGNSPHDYELHRALYSFAISRYNLDKGNKGCPKVDELLCTLQANSPASQCMQQLIIGDKLLMMKDYSQATPYYEQFFALKVNLPHHFAVIAGAHRRFSFICQITKQNSKAEEHYYQFCLICAVHYPTNGNYGGCLLSFGVLCRDTERQSEAEIRCLRALRIFSVRDIDAAYFPKCVFVLRSIY